LGDNRRVDFARCMIFLTSNLGGRETTSLLRPNLGFAASEAERQTEAGSIPKDLAERISRAAVEAARRRFTPEFINRIDKIVVFKPLGVDELRQILTLELNIIQQRIFSSTIGVPFVFLVAEDARDFLLSKGTDMQYGARHLKRAIDRNVVQPLSNLIATGQVRAGDLIRITSDLASARLTFFKECEGISTYGMVQMVDPAVVPNGGAFSANTISEQARANNARSSRR
jgi:ATP-dependent Clp protease ATP-binding subunit ClpB